MRTATRTITGSLLVVALLFGACTSEKPAAPSPTPPGSVPAAADEIQAAFTAYTDALAAGDPEAAADYLASSTVSYLAGVRRLALRGSKKQLHTRPLVERLSALVLRFLAPAGTIKDLKPREVAVFALDIGLLGKGGAAEQEIVQLTEQGPAILGTVAVRGQIESFRHSFVLEGGEWHVDLLDSVRDANDSFAQLAAASGDSEDDYLFGVIEQQAGIRPKKSLWKPPVPVGGAAP